MADNRLSELDEPLLLIILSLIPIETAIVTSFLARNHTAWTKLTDLVFNFNHLNPCFFHGNEIISQITKLHSFCVDFAPTSDLLSHPLVCQTLESWINAVCLRNEVKKIQVTVGCRLLPNSSIVLSPSCIKCSSLEVLSLKGPFHFEVEDLNLLNLPALRVLQLQVGALPTELITYLVVSSLLLEELTLGAHFITGESLVSWINTLCLRGMVTKIQVALGSLKPNPSTILLPSAIIRCSSLQVISFKGPFQFEFKYSVVNLPSLRILQLDIYALQSEFIARVLDSCLFLEELTLAAYHSVMDEQNLHISNPNLSKLSLSIRTNPNNTRGNFVIDCSNLKHLTLYAPSLSIFHLENMNKGALLTASISSDHDNQITRKDHQIIRDDDPSFTNLALHVQCVFTLHLDSATLLKFACLTSDSIYFKNLTELNIELKVNPVLRWDDVVNFLRYTPKLEVLTVDVNARGMGWGDPPYSPGGLASVKRVEMIRFRGDARDLSFISYILRNASALEFLSVGVVLGDPTNRDEPFEWPEIQLCKKLFYYERSSSSCQIDFSGGFLKASTKGFYTGSLIPHCNFVEFGYLGIKGDFEPMDGASMIKMDSRDPNPIPTHMKLSGDLVNSWNDVLSALEDSPHLEALRVNVDTYSFAPLHIGHDRAPPRGFGLLKWIRITGFAGTKDDVEMMAYILLNAQALELLSLDAHLYADNDEDKIWNNSKEDFFEEYDRCHKLFRLKRSSLTSCEIEYSGKLLKASSKCLRDGVPCVQIIHLNKLFSIEGLQCINGALEEAEYSHNSARFYESIREPVTSEDESESISEPVTSEDESESISEPAVTSEDESESISEPAVTSEDESESISEPVTPENESESSSEESDDE